MRYNQLANALNVSKYAKLECSLPQEVLQLGFMLLLPIHNHMILFVAKDLTISSAVSTVKASATDTCADRREGSRYLKISNCILGAIVARNGF
jgi:hypothetical protein